MVVVFQKDRETEERHIHTLPLIFLSSIEMKLDKDTGSNKSVFLSHPIRPTKALT